MRALSKYNWAPDSNDKWIINLQYLDNQSFVASGSDGSLANYSVAQPNTQPIWQVKKAHTGSINSIKQLGNYSLVSCGLDGIKLWDIRAGCKPVHSTSGNYLSLGTDYKNTIAGGTELQGSDAELHMWDIRNFDTVVRSYVDSHHDDITDIKFHPTIPHYMMSGSTDGYVNIYNLNEPDEDESLHQVINFASVHSCHFIQENRISILSHMETLGFYELNNTNYEQNDEPFPKELGDVRSLWPDCEYVVDVNPRGYVSYGANSQEKLSMYPFNPTTESFDLTKPIWFPQAHGEEVVRDVYLVPNTQTVLSCGEDGYIRLWEIPHTLQDYTFGDEDTMDTTEEVPKKEKKEKKSKKDRKDKKGKKDKGSTRFKPY